MDSLSRRQLLALGAAAAIDASARHQSRRRRRPGNPFTLGVCAGDPDERSAVLWTRLTEPDGSGARRRDVAVTWELADDESFTSVVGTGRGRSRSSRRGAQRARRRRRRRPVVLPLPHRGVDEPDRPGRARRRPIRLSSGSPRRAASTTRPGTSRPTPTSPRGRPDLVVFLGDFIYEYGGQNLGGDVVRSHGSGETFTLDEYRQRYALLPRPTPSCRQRVAVCPWLVIWDDHEVENNYAAVDVRGRRAAGRVRTLDDSPPTRRGGSTCRCASRGPPAPTTRSSIARSGGVRSPT